MRTEELYELQDVEVKHETDKALLVLINGTEEMWLPRSQVREVHKDSIVMTAWLAKERGLI